MKRRQGRKRYKLYTASRPQAREAGADTGRLPRNGAKHFRSPARVNIIGEHTDDNDGLVLPMTTGLYTRVDDVEPRDLVSLNIDYDQMGVGGDDSWGKRTLLEYSLTERRYSYGFTLLPYRPASGRLDELVRR